MSAVVSELTAADIQWWTQAPAPWPASRPVLEVALELLPVLDDPLAADVIEQLMSALACREDELRSVREVLSAALTEAHTLHLEVRRLREVLAQRQDRQRRREDHMTTTKDSPAAVRARVKAKLDKHRADQEAQDSQEDDRVGANVAPLRLTLDTNAAPVLPPPTRPMSVARELVTALYTLPMGLALRDHRGEFYRWNGTNWPEVDKRDVRAAAYQFLEHATYVHPKDGPTPYAPSRRKIDDVVTRSAPWCCWIAWPKRRRRRMPG